ncbi:MAG: DUF2345 domain-containing protein, partial [Actinobacteria bacterium]|nr:DUF2345 domain-containing protein [Actinomycetota bacterium]
YEGDDLVESDSNISQAQLLADNDLFFSPEDGMRYAFELAEVTEERSIRTYYTNQWVGDISITADPDEDFDLDTQPVSTDLLPADSAEVGYIYQDEGEDARYVYDSVADEQPEDDEEIELGKTPEDGNTEGAVELPNTDDEGGDEWWFEGKSGLESSTWYGEKTYYQDFYRTEVNRTLHTHDIAADRDIDIDFFGKDAGSINVESGGDVVLSGDLQNDTGNTSVQADGDIRMAADNADGIVAGDSVDLSAGNGIGEVLNRGDDDEAPSFAPVFVNTDGGKFDAKSDQGDIVVEATQGGLAVGNVTASRGDVSIRAQSGDITATDDDNLIRGKKLWLTAEQGSIGQLNDDGQPTSTLNIDTSYRPADAGNERASLRAIETLTADAQGDVVIEEVDGDLTDNRTYQELKDGVWAEMALTDEGRVDDAVENLENRKLGEYERYWELRQGSADEEIGNISSDTDYGLREVDGRYVLVDISEDEDGNIVDGGVKSLEPSDHDDAEHRFYYGEAESDYFTLDDHNDLLVGDDVSLGALDEAVDDAESDQERAAARQFRDEMQRLLDVETDEDERDPGFVINRDDLEAYSGDSLTYRRVADHDPDVDLSLSKEEEEGYRTSLEQQFIDNRGLEKGSDELSSAVDDAIQTLNDDRQERYEQLHDEYGGITDYYASDLKDRIDNGDIDPLVSADQEQALRKTPTLMPKGILPSMPKKGMSVPKVNTPKSTCPVAWIV